MKQTFFLVHGEARERAKSAVDCAPEGYIVTISEPTRTLEQNAALWPLLEEISQQVMWHGLRLTEKQWKDMFTATLKGQQSVPNLEGNGFIILGQSSSKMSKKEFSDLLTLAQAFAAQHDVKCAA